jgi:ribonuclease D
VTAAHDAAPDASEEAPTANPGEAPTATPLTVPEDGVPPIVETPEALREAEARMAAGEGPVAVDAERASGFRYGQKAYLAQFKRRGAGIVLVDTAALTDLSGLSDSFGGAEWVLHAASQDLPGLRDLGMEPAAVFDTELAARMLGWPKVGLAAVVERELGLTLAKEHSAQDWSERPLPSAWLNYAALDVEVLLEVRDGLERRLIAAEKLDWARQEFEAIRTATPTTVRVDPWRRTASSHLVKDRRGQAIVKALWEAREEAAVDQDTAPGRVLRDQAIVAAAQAKPASLDALLAIREWQSRGNKRRAPQWYSAIAAAMALPEKLLPDLRGPRADGPPQARMWADKKPEAAVRLEAAKKVIAALMAQHDIPAENLLQPDALRRVCWDYAGGGEAEVVAVLRERSARPWQIGLIAAPLAGAFAAIEAGDAGSVRA